ncbi:MAG: metallophosphoesterase [Cyanobacteria bacterium J06649_4]
MNGPNNPGKKTRRPAHRRRLVLIAVFLITAVSVIAMQFADLPGPTTADSASDNPSNISVQPVSPLENTSAMAKPLQERIASISEPQKASDAPQLLTDPFLQLPTASSVQVVWFTEFEGTDHRVEYGDNFSATATTTKLSRTREDSDSFVQDRAYPELSQRDVWRHEATVTGLTPGNRPSYRVTSTHANGQRATSDFFTLSAAPAPGQPLQILLTSDHQLKPLTPANLQKVEETVGRVDAVFFAGDLINIPDRASEWFDSADGLAFFPGLQGRANHSLTKGDTTTVYKGGQLIQHAPLFPAIGNHEVMGRYASDKLLKAQYASALPRRLVSQFYPVPDGSSAEQNDEKWIKDHSFNSDTYEEIFSLPTSQNPDGSETETYYAVSFGDVRLVSLYVTQIWRPAALSPDTRGRYREKADSLNSPEDWGYGQHIFEDIREGSQQYQWLQKELASDDFKNAKYKIIMLHHPPHTLGGNIVPAFTDPVLIENKAPNGSLQSIQYEYPPEEDYIVRDLIPLLESANAQLVFFGHSHLWNRFVGPTGIHFLETSNVGNSYGAHTAEKPRNIPTNDSVAEAGDLRPFAYRYSATGDPNGLEPVMPTLSPITDDSGNPQPFIASNDITSFSIFDTATSTISSYYFDTRKPSSAVVKFDEFSIGQ